MWFNSSNADYFVISIHEEGQFMPGYGKLYGSKFVLEAAKSGRHTNVDYTLDLTVTTYMDTTNSPCHSVDRYYPLSQCIDEYVEAKLDCK